MHAVAPSVYVERDVEKDPRKCHLLGFLQVRMSPISLKWWLLLSCM
jgi:hypothetical protein